MRKFLITSAAALALFGGPLVAAAATQSQSLSEELGNAPNYTPPHADPRPWAVDAHNAAGADESGAASAAVSSGETSPRVDLLGSESGSDAKNTRNLRWPLR